MDAAIKETLLYVFTDGLGKIREVTNKDVEEIDITLGFIASKYVLQLLNSGDPNFTDPTITSRLVNGILFRYLALNPNNRGSNAYRKYLGLSQSQLDTLVVKFIEQNMDSEYQSSSLRKATFISIFLSSLFKNSVDDRSTTYNNILTQIDEIVPVLFKTKDLLNNHASLLIEFGKYLEETDDLDSLYFLHNQ
jgi:hypothetical protein